MKKVMITPYFGDFPPWFEQFKENFRVTLGEQGYDWMMFTNLDDFKRIVKDKLGLDYPGLPGTGKVWDYRCALGFLYSEEISGYDFWGHMDFDMCFGDVSQWVTDEFLSELDLHSNHHEYVNGCFSLYRNTLRVNTLFMHYPGWQEKMKYPDANGWVEQEFSRTLEKSGLRYKYTFWQGDPYTTDPHLEFRDGKLYQDGNEIAMFHFRRSKRWPLHA